MTRTFHAHFMFHPTATPMAMSRYPGLYRLSHPHRYQHTIPASHPDPSVHPYRMYPFYPSLQDPVLFFSFLISLGTVSFLSPSCLLPPPTSDPIRLLCHLSHVSSHLKPASPCWSCTQDQGWCLVLRAVPKAPVAPVHRSKASGDRGDWASPRGPQASLGSFRRSARTLALAVRVV